jgi:hypothetical protein
MFEKDTPDQQLESVLETPAASQEQSEHTNEQTVETKPEQPAAEAQPITENAQERNFRIARQKTKRAEQERDAALARIRELEEKNRPPEQQDDDTLTNLAADDLAEGRHLNKMSMELKRMRNEIKQLKQESFEMSAETRLKVELPDFNKIVSEENIALLKDMYPEVALTLQSAPDLYTKAKSAYTLIKKLGVHVEDNFEREREVVQKNAAKPKPLASVSPQQGDSPLSRANAFANGLTQELKDQLNKEMNESRKGY